MQTITDKELLLLNENSEIIVVAIKNNNVHYIEKCKVISNLIESIDDGLRVTLKYQDQTIFHDKGLYYEISLDISDCDKENLPPKKEGKYETFIFKGWSLIKEIDQFFELKQKIANMSMEELTDFLKNKKHEK